MELLNDIAKWQRDTFGWKVTPEAAVERLKKELDEFLDNPCGEEAADCVIMAVDLFRSVEEDSPHMHIHCKHARNGMRLWKVALDGTGQHVEE